MPRREEYQMLRSKGLCVQCRKPSLRLRCPRCQRKHNHGTPRQGWAAERYRRRQAAGLCTFCDKPRVNASLCEEHREEHRRRNREYQRRLRTASRETDQGRLL